MRCPDDIKLNMLTDNELSCEDERVMLRHIETCASCRERYQQLSDIAAFIEAEPAIGPRTDLSAAVMKQVRAIERPRVNSLQLIVAGIIAVVVSLILSQIAGNTLGTLVDILEYNTYSGDVPGAQTLMLYAVLALFAIDIIAYGLVSSVKRRERIKN